MLVLTRKPGQSIIVNGNIEIIVTAVDGDQVKIGINAPSDIHILRKEVAEAVESSNREATVSRNAASKLRGLMKKD